ncbi:hypothetical protein BS17DRAFT_690481 [Gyrodon lividus]|nr:hypothetical protein BS17DRAFT_690481 [Gyrodon lividus]
MPYGNCRHIPQAAKEQIIVMSTHMKASRIAEVTGISARTVRRTLNLWWKTGGVTAQQSLNKPGRPQKLNSLDIFLEGCIERTPDIYLIELQQELKEACGMIVDETNISHTLCQRGFLRKQVIKH